MTPKTYVFFGIVGAGKGTQIELLKKLMNESDTRNIVDVAPGIEYRVLKSSDSFTGKLVNEIYDKGELQPDFLTISICSQMMLRDMTPDCHLVVDAYPRTIRQAQAFIDAMEFYKRENVEVVYIEISKEEAMKRMKLRGRSDDTEEGINRRFWEYENNVIPAMKVLESKGYTLHTINGEQSVEAVHEDLKKALAL